MTELLAGRGFETSQVYATVRAKNQADVLSAAGINVVQLDLSDEEKVNDLIVKNQSKSSNEKRCAMMARGGADNLFSVQLVIHTATSIDPKPAALLIAALEEVKKVMAKKTYFIHVSRTV